MKREELFILTFGELGIEDVPLVGGKNAALGEMYSHLSPLGVNIPDGFAVTASAYRFFLNKSGLEEKIEKILDGLDTHDIRSLQSKGRKIRRKILNADLPKELEDQIGKAYEHLEDLYGKGVSVAVRSSATAEDLPGASFAGQQETYLNISGKDALLIHVKKCIASLFTDRAISYRVDKGFSHMTTALSVGVQKMVRSDIASSGVAFTIDTESGFENVVVINAIYGLGEFIVQGKVVPDEFIVFKPSLEKGFNAIIAQDMGKKNVKLVYGNVGTKESAVPEEDRNRFCLEKSEVLTLAKWCVTIEKYFSEKHGRYQPMDIEWAKDGQTGELFIVQARPETVHSMKDKNVLKEYVLREKGDVLSSGIAVGAGIGSGPSRVIKSVSGITSFKKGEVLVTEITDPDWEPIMKIASAIVTDKGGRTSHAAIVSRELGIPCIVGTGNATRVIKTGMDVTVDCASGEVGKIYKGILSFTILEHKLKEIPKTKTKLMLNIGSPEEAFKLHSLPVKGVGLGRLEFIIASHIRIHPNALIDYSSLASELKEISKGWGALFISDRQHTLRQIIEAIDAQTAGYEKKEQFYVDELAEGIAKIASAFWPNDVIIRFSDFKTNEYRKLVGGELYEPEEENPMLGWRGASRYYDEKFKSAFGLECRAIKKARDEMGLKNIIPMIPFCRTPEEGRHVIKIMESYGLHRSKDATLKVYVMCEIPSNILLAEEFLSVFDGMSIGSNDLAQLTLGLDRDSGIVSHIANEKNESVKKLIAEIVKKCNKQKKYIGICGQAPSDYPDFAEFLVDAKIESMSLNPDTVIKTLMLVGEKEKKGKK